ncbi:winged helix-turn-helix domain-containing protein [Paenibacillus sp. TAF43_2]|uniref:winged helix-turn-helix domain-containing protein n=1 Tax=Paenibacillus sp. TAF43_2 TaxID=3233069 RepID=UPI003F98AD56
MKWDAGAYTIAWKAQKILLLPKEYALLHFMYSHAGQTLSREQLLDNVWPMEAPVDRTVDDHIYRLRRKLAQWSPTIQIDTVRGLGYRLLLKQGGLNDNPLIELPSFTEELSGIVSTYLRYGRGDALLMLTRNEQVLGFKVDPTLKLLFRVMEGDVRFIVREEAGSFADRAFLLLYLNQFIDPQDNREYVAIVRRQQVLAQIWQNELETMSIISMLMDWGEFEAAKEKLDLLKAEVKRNNWEGLIPYTANLELEFVLRAELWSEVDSAAEVVEAKLKQFPYQREEGHYLVLKGIALYRSNRKSGLSFIEQGFSLLKQSHFLANLLNSYHTLLIITKVHGWGADRDYFVKEWSRLTAQIGLDDIAKQVKEQLQAELKPY